VLIDFNVAQQKQWTTTSTVVGKHAYLPAEQFRGKPTTQSDLYAMGATLYFLCTGKDPEPITCSHPRSVNDNVGVELDSVVAILTAAEPEDRYKSAADVRRALQSIEKELVISILQDDTIELRDSDSAKEKVVHSTRLRV
jgi:serine/threonine-protein kinase